MLLIVQTRIILFNIKILVILVSDQLLDCEQHMDK